MKSINNSKNIYVIIALAFIVMLAGYYLFSPRNVDSSNYKQFSESDLGFFDGTIADRPIYIGYNGFVYDVTKGKEYYVPEGSYHYLAGRDSSKELDLIGGEIIKRKYPIIGVLVK